MFLMNVELSHLITVIQASIEKILQQIRSDLMLWLKRTVSCGTTPTT